MTRSDPSGWLAPAFAIVAAITAARLVLLAFNRTDLFVDESQYWLWGQDFAFGYYSKPPLIAWVIGAVTTLSGSDAPFWVRAPAPVFHAATALILGALAAHLHGVRAAIWVAVSYALLPMVTLGSLLISTDTIMAPFFAAAIYFHTRLIATGLPQFALLAGLMAGMAFLAKYAAVYFVLGAGLGALLIPAFRISARDTVLMIGTFAVVILPNILWNLSNGYATAAHTMDNIRWVHEENPFAHLDPAGMAVFFVSQLGVFGPVLFCALIVAAFGRGATGARALLVFVIPAILIVCVQALLDRAYANWAASAYFAGTVVAVAVLLPRPRWLILSVGLTGAIAVALPVLTLFPKMTLGGDRPVLARYLGRADISRQILQLAAARNLPVVTNRRDVIADLFYTGRDAGVPLYAALSAGRPASHYEQSHAVPPDLTGPVLFVSATEPDCGTFKARVAGVLDTAGGAYANVPLAAYLVDAGCLHAAP